LTRVLQYVTIYRDIICGRLGNMFKHFHEQHRHARFFEKGDLKYVILDLLKDKPSHGYEIIRALEERFHGLYSPSAGSVYPTLQLLEDMGYVNSSEQDGKKIYTITEEGRKFLKEREETIEKIKEHMRGWCGTGNREEFRESMREAMHEFRNLAHTIRDKAYKLDSDKWDLIREIIVKACRDIENIVEEKTNREY
jgi:DNA-binding PadR family transcriptional regulator